ncbi:hypothetical protein SDC9_207908 [bioreactor metagenome]|uniref:Uncharacterized protein n=1 Tax=bioreactor metagenome TaxID=1076179 RepID=A0A645JKM1_9ZZZZ
MVIQANFPNAHHLGVGRHLLQLVQVVPGDVVGVLGVDAYHGVDKGELLRQADGILRGF